MSISRPNPRRWWALVALAVAQFLVIMDTSIIGVALPAIQRAVARGPGGYLFVPRGTPHAYKKVGPAPGRMLLLVSPGGIHEHFLAETGALDPPDPERIATLGEKYGVELLADPDG